MRVLIDTNVLISAALSANGTPYQAYVKAASYPNHGLICEQNVDEMKRIFNKKFPNRLAALDKFLSVALLTLELVPVPTEEDMTETQIRDVNHTLSGDYDTGRVFEFMSRRHFMRKQTAQNKEITHEDSLL